MGTRGWSRRSSPSYSDTKRSPPALEPWCRVCWSVSVMISGRWGECPAFSIQHPVAGSFGQRCYPGISEPRGRFCAFEIVFLWVTIERKGGYDRKLPRANDMEEGDGVGRSNLPRNRRFSCCREVRSFWSTAEVCGLHCFEHSGRARSTGVQRLQAVHRHRLWLTLRARNPTAAFRETRPP